MKRAGVLTALMAYGGALVALHPTAGQLPQRAVLRWMQTDPEQALVSLCWALCWLIAVWFFLVTSLSAAATARNRGGRLAGRWARRLTPLAVRRLLETTLGLALAVGPAGAAVAAPAGSSGAGVPAAASISQAAPPALAAVPAPILAPEPPIPDLDRPSAVTLPPPSPATPHLSAPANRIHVVRPGDTLWGLAAEPLGATASAADITRAWESWYALNRASIGADPSLLLPGERLTVPRNLA